MIGSGPTGLMAASDRRARSGSRVILADEGSQTRRSLLFENEEIDGRPGLDWACERHRRTRFHAECDADAAHDHIRLV